MGIIFEVRPALSNEECRKNGATKDSLSSTLLALWNRNWRRHSNRIFNNEERSDAALSEWLAGDIIKGHSDGIMK